MVHFLVKYTIVIKIQDPSAYRAFPTTVSSREERRRSSFAKCICLLCRCTPVLVLVTCVCHVYHCMGSCERAVSVFRQNPSGIGTSRCFFPRRPLGQARVAGRGRGPHKPSLTSMNIMERFPLKKKRKVKSGDDQKLSFPRFWLPSLIWLGIPPPHYWCQLPGGSPTPRGLVVSR